jgi:glutathione S-transferase
MTTIYGMPDSGNCYKPRLLMALLGRPFRHVEVSSRDGGTRQADFLAKNPNGMVPLLELDDGRLLAESNAILCYLADGTPFVPADAFDRAKMLQWMFFEQYSHEPNVAVRRALLTNPVRRDQATPEKLAATLAGGNRALAVMEAQLARTAYLAGSQPTLADIALYAYTHCADEGGFDLTGFPGIRRWLGDVAALPGFRPMSWLPAPLPE